MNLKRPLKAIFEIVVLLSHLCLLLEVFFFLVFILNFGNSGVAENLSPAVPR